MKKIIAIVLAVMLVAGGLGGFVYANSSSHQPMTGEKLVGTGRLGLQPDGEWLSFSWFVFTNPDCVGQIRIRKISLIRKDGTVIYEGPLLKLVRDESGEVVEEIPITKLKPHEIRVLGLNSFMKDPEASDPTRWLTHEEVRNLNFNHYTLEIFWVLPGLRGPIRIPSKGLPLIGWVAESKRATDPALQDLVTEESELWKLETSHSRTPMVNMNQRLKP